MGRGKITIRTENVTLDGSSGTAGAAIHAGDFVMVAVQDDGSGMDEETLAHIFEPFFSRTVGGTGLGLSICQKIIEAHRGKIWCYPNKETGCRFTFRLPIGN